ncbi:unnamed protein product [Nesidiocoris tenuis]|uniref:Uncharacterized protein n=1 Tax=Nesidiocoris tenuis TaxID=355587 RepID=A0A6H5HJ99_9HEMI|nr:unnamed protein product [Nesidiocoris tenuis]
MWADCRFSPTPKIFSTCCTPFPLLIGTHIRKPSIKMPEKRIVKSSTFHWVRLISNILAKIWKKKTSQPSDQSLLFRTSTAPMNHFLNKCLSTTNLGPHWPRFSKMQKNCKYIYKCHTAPIKRKPKESPAKCAEHRASQFLGLSFSLFLHHRRNFYGRPTCEHSHPQLLWAISAANFSGQSYVISALAHRGEQTWETNLYSVGLFLNACINYIVLENSPCYI